MRLTNHPGLDGGPSWSPDGITLAFYSNREDNVDIYTISSDGSGLRRRTTESSMELMPTWSPDGTELFYTSDRGGDQLRAVALASGADRLVSDRLEHHNPVSFGPRGERMVGIARDGDDWDLIAMSIDGTLEAQLDTVSSRSSGPAWSPSGTTVVYSSRRAGDWSLYLMELGAETSTPLTDLEGRELDATWLPDGERIYFSSNSSGAFLIYKIRPDGTDKQQVVVR